MPDGDEDISWPWIKESLPSINLTKVGILFFSPFYPLYPYRTGHFALFGTAFWDEPVQDIYQIVEILSTPMQSQCNLLSLDIFKDDIPKVPK